MDDPAAAASWGVAYQEGHGWSVVLVGYGSVVTWASGPFQSPEVARRLKLSLSRKMSRTATAPEVIGHA